MRILHGDCRDAIKNIPDNNIDSIVTDPPYGISFMAKQWDNGSVAFDPAFWQECLRVLKPGGHLLAFGGSRTEHRLVCAVEDAGFEIRDKLCWVTGAGFPKGRNIAKDMDRLMKAERPIVGQHKTGSMGFTLLQKVHGAQTVNITDFDRLSDQPISAEAQKWDGWNVALKPAVEFVCMARKPLSEKSVAANILRWGVGGINIDGCRVPTGDKLGGGGGNSPNAVYSQPGWVRPWMSDPASQQNHMAVVRDNIAHAEALGRWPANFLHDGSDEVLAVFPAKTKSRSGGTTSRTSKADYRMATTARTGHDDEGSVSRYFASFPPEASRCIYQSKASAKEREFGLEDEPKDVVLIGAERHKMNPMTGKEVVDRPRANTNPCVKPLALMRYLCRLITPPNGIVLDPFMGSGSTGIAAIQEGFDFVGIEQDSSYFAIAEKRIAAASTSAKNSLLDARMAQGPSSSLYSANSTTSVPRENP